MSFASSLGVNFVTPVVRALVARRTSSLHYLATHMTFMRHLTAMSCNSTPSSSESTSSNHCCNSSSCRCFRFFLLGDFLSEGGCPACASASCAYPAFTNISSVGPAISACPFEGEVLFRFLISALGPAIDSFFLFSNFAA